MLAPGLDAQAYEYVRCTTFCDVVDASHRLLSSSTGSHIENSWSGSSIIPSKPEGLRNLSPAQGTNLSSWEGGYVAFSDCGNADGFIIDVGVRDTNEATGQ